MSFILDALKKSESERLKKSTPGVADIPESRPPARTPRWLWAFAGLLVLNLGVLAVLLIRPGTEADSATVTRRLEVPDDGAGAQAPAFSDLVAEAKQRHRAEPPPAAEPETGSAGTAPAGSTDAAPRRDPPPDAPVRSPGRPTPGAVDADALPTLLELQARGELSLPPLHLDLHVYAERPADRFVVVNMHRYREGEALAEGPVVQQILPRGVVLEQQGTAFFLPR
jgi:general secretion pathway protein B